MTRVAIVHQGFVPAYRVGFFERLARQSDVEYVVFHGRPPSGSGHRAAEGPFAFPNVRVENRELAVGGKMVVVQPIVRRILGGGFDGAVVGAELKFPAGLAAAAALRARGGGLILWGQGYEKREDGAGRLARAGAVAKRGLARLADGYLAYTEGGSRALTAAGVTPERVTVVRNTLDMGREEALHAALTDADDAALRRRLGLRPDSRVLLYLGRAYREKRLEELVETARRLGARTDTPDVEVAVLGDGPDLARIRKLAAGVPSVRLLGDVYDGEEVARWLRVASAVAIPGKVGLAVNHALAHGVPVFTRESDLHAPEVEYLKGGENALIVPGDLDAYVDELARVLGDDRALAALAAGALRSRERLRLEYMVRSFDEGVRAALLRRRR